MQSKKCESKKSSAKRCNRCIALHVDCAIAIASTISRRWTCRLQAAGAARAQPGAGPELASSGLLLITRSFVIDLSAHSFRDSSTGRSTWWGCVFALEDVLEMAENLSTVSKWKKELDVLGERQRWGRSHPLPFVLERGSPSSHQKLQHRRGAFVHGITGSALKKDNVVEHSKIGHPQEGRFSWATADENDKRNLEEHAHRESRSSCFVRGEGSRQPRLFEVAYMISREEMPFTKFLAIVELDKRHGVCLGQTYHTEHKCQEFASIIGEMMSDDLVEALRSCRYMSVLMDESTDSSVTEKGAFLRLRLRRRVCKRWKKLLINIETNFSWNDSGIKVANQNWKSKLLPDW